MEWVLVAALWADVVSNELPPVPPPYPMAIASADFSTLAACQAAGLAWHKVASPLTVYPTAGGYLRYSCVRK